MILGTGLEGSLRSRQFVFIREKESRENGSVNPGGGKLCFIWGLFHSKYQDLGF